MKIKLALIAFSFMILAQAKAQNWGGGVDDDQLNFGFTFQYIASEYKIYKNANWRDPILLQSDLTNNLKAISSPVAAGFGIGFVANYNIFENLDLRSNPALVFTDRKMMYEYEPSFSGINSEKVITKVTKSSMIDLPVYLKLKSDRVSNMRAYMLGGLKYSIDMSSKKKTSNDGITDEAEKNLLNKKQFLSYEAGIGFDFYFEWFKLSPELKISHSLKSILNKEGNAFDTPIEKAKLRHFTFSIYIQ